MTICRLWNRSRHVLPGRAGKIVGDAAPEATVTANVICDLFAVRLNALVTV